MAKIFRMNMTEGYTILEHPSDLGIEARGKSMKDAFEFAAIGLLSIICDPASVIPLDHRYVSVKGTDAENLLVKWLSEILYLYDGEDFLSSFISIDRLSPTELDATVAGERVDEKKHRLKTDVKAVTYHQLKVEEVQDGCLVRVYFDI
jgi:SHS2 domain-containing protein